MRRVNPQGIHTREPHISAALGAVAVQNIRFGLNRSRRDVTDRILVAKAEMSVHRHALNAEFANRGEVFQCDFGLRAGGRSVSDDADEMAALSLRASKVHDMPKQPADRRAQHMQNAQRPVHPNLPHCIFSA